MIKLFSLLILVIHYGNAAKLGVFRIVNGTSVSISDYPYQVSLCHQGKHICGASILSSRFILTAAHCTEDTIPGSLSIRAGSSYRTSGGTVYAVEKVWTHPGYVSSTYENDVSIIKLSTDLNLGRGVRAVNLPSSGTIIRDGLMAWATGWGMLYDEGPPADQLQAVQLPTISTESCRQFYGQGVTDEMFCAGYETGGRDTCVGDSGGPLVVSGIQIGITSWGLECAAPRKPGAYAKLPRFRDYIDSIINNN